MGTLTPQLQQWTGHPDRESIRKKEALNDTLDQMDWTDTYGAFTFPPTV